MRSGLKLWPGFPFRRTSSAWGIALEDRGATLVCLGRTAGEGVRVLQAQWLRAPPWAQAPDSHHDWLLEALRDASTQEVRRHRRLVLALPMDRCRSGSFEPPAPLDPEVLQAEVQLEAAQSLKVSTQEVSFDFALEPHDHAPPGRVHWLACLRSEVQAWQRHTRAAGWRLPAIEPQEQAARRAAQALLGGQKNLLAQAHQDWQFRASDPAAGVPDAALEAALRPLQGTPVWAWLCACGAGLRALS